jgi:hypothetical protein
MTLPLVPKSQMVAYGVPASGRSLPKIVILSLPKDLQPVPFFKRVAAESAREIGYGRERGRRILEVLRQAQDDNEEGPLRGPERFAQLQQLSVSLGCAAMLSGINVH